MTHQAPPLQNAYTPICLSAKCACTTTCMREGVPACRPPQAGSTGRQRRLRGCSQPAQQPVMASGHMPTMGERQGEIRDAEGSTTASHQAGQRTALYMNRTACAVAHHTRHLINYYQLADGPRCVRELTLGAHS